METSIATAQVRVLTPQITPEEIDSRVTARRAEGFGLLGKLPFGRPRPEAVEVASRQTRHLPVWHLVGHAVYEYDRAREFRIDLSRPEVRYVVIGQQRLDPAHDERHIMLRGTEHVRDERNAEYEMDARTKARHAAQWASNPATVAGSLSDIGAPGDTVDWPETPAAEALKPLLGEIAVAIDAERVDEERIDVTTLELLFRPILVVEYRYGEKSATSALDLVRGSWGDVPPASGAAAPATLQELYAIDDPRLRELIGECARPAEGAPASALERLRSVLGR